MLNSSLASVPSGNVTQTTVDADKQESGLRLETTVTMMTGGNSGPAIVPGNADQSLLAQAIRGVADVT